MSQQRRARDAGVADQDDGGSELVLGRSRCLSQCVQVADVRDGGSGGRPGLTKLVGDCRRDQVVNVGHSPAARIAADGNVYGQATAQFGCTTEAIVLTLIRTNVLRWQAEPKEVPMATQLNVHDPRRHTWMLFIGFALLFVIFAAFNYVYIPTIEPADPDQGWAWLTLDPDIIEYIKFNFRVLGVWVLGFAVLVGALAGIGLRYRQRGAWFAAWYVPAHVLLVSSMMPWVLPITGPLALIAVAALLWSRRWFFFTVDNTTN